MTRRPARGLAEHGDRRGSAPGDRRERRPYPWREGPGGRELPLAWQEHEGFYTAYGEVTTLLAAADDRLAVFGSGEEVLSPSARR